MKTIGTLLKESRVRKRFSIKKVEEGTKIKREFIEKIEKENWPSLPSFSVVAGFVRNIASYLGIDEENALAVLRRDYPPRPVSINPKPDISNEFIWSPKLTFIAGVGIVLIMILGYLGFQYSSFVSPPKLSIEKPSDGEVVVQRNLLVVGKTNSDATIKVNNQPAIVSPEGDFETTIEVSENTGEIVVKAESRAGRETVVRRKIVTQFK